MGEGDFGFVISYWLLGASLVWENPGWNPELSEAEALAVPGRFFNWPPNKSFDLAQDRFGG